MQTTVARTLHRDRNCAVSFRHGAKLANADVELTAYCAPHGHAVRFAGESRHGEIAAYKNLTSRRYRIDQRCSRCFCVEGRDPDHVETPVNGMCAFDQLVIGEAAAKQHWVASPYPEYSLIRRKGATMRKVGDYANLRS